MEDHAERIGSPILKEKRTVLFGEGKAPANLVAVKDVAEIAIMVLREQPRNDVVWIGGPQNLSATDVVGTYARVTGQPARVTHVPLWFLRAVRGTVGRALPVVGRVIDAGIFAESGAQTIDMTATLQRYPIRLTLLEEFIRAQHPEVRCTP